MHNITNIVVLLLIGHLVLKYISFILGFTLYEMKRTGIDFGNRIISIALLGTLINLFRFPYLVIRGFLFRLVSR